MDAFARLRAEERKAYFSETAARLGIRPQHVEKDFWVCWTLYKLFGLPEIGDHLTFKGGTSLSKAHRLIQRFSEDIDITVSRTYLGFGGEHDPANAPSAKKRKAWLEDLKQACGTFVSKILQDTLRARIAEHLRTEDFELSIDTNDPDQQTLALLYPSCWPEDAIGERYFGKFVRIEMGARSDTWPNEILPVTPYVAELYPNLFVTSACSAHVLAAERTMWEKVALLHEENCRPTDKPLKARLSRHYSDVARLIERGLGDKALRNLELLRRVVEHRSVFFGYTWVDYDRMKAGTFRIVPRENRVSEWEADYEKTREMFFEEPPPFKKVLETITQLENRLNSSA